MGVGVFDDELFKGSGVYLGGGCGCISFERVGDKT